MSRPPPGGNGIGNGYPRSNPPGGPNANGRLNAPHVASRPGSAGNGNGPPSAAMSRAERFEDEKRRIIESCFSKLDQNGQLAESYITHIRIQEDGSYPSAPPPPDSPPEHKKPRLIIIAVRSTGRVRMHKARENNNGSFSIGKTWNMEELSCIETYANPPTPPQNEKEANHRAWAGSVGFTVTLAKPYYWQAGTSKEKDFFIASVVKIYRKYTKGQVPELKGFDERERNQILGGFAPPGGPPPGSHPPPSSSGRTLNDQHSGPQPPQPPFVHREQSRDGSRYRASPGPPPSVSDPRPGSGPASRRPSESPARFNDRPPPGGGPRSFASTEQIRQPSRDGARPDPRPGTSPGPGPPPGQRPPPNGQQFGRSGVPPPPPSPGLPHPAAAAAAADTPPPLRPNNPAQSPLHPPIDGTSEERRSNEMPPANETGKGASLFQAARDRYMNYQAHTPEPVKTPPAHGLAPIDLSASVPRDNGNAAQQPSTAASESFTGIDLDDAAAVGALTSYWGPEHSSAAAPPAGDPQLEGPPTSERSRKRVQAEHDAPAPQTDLRPAPFQGRGNSDTNGVRSALPVAEPTAPEQPSPGEAPQVPNEPETEATSPDQVSGPLASPTLSQEDADEDYMDEEQYRPGLGPMFKKKAIASRFKKAAHTAGAFKPRPGGAAEKILKAKADRDGEPDGITGVVPRPQARTKQDSAPVTPVEATFAREDVAEEPPKVEISSPKSSPRDRADPEVRTVELFDSTQHVQFGSDQDMQAAEDRQQEREREQEQEQEQKQEQEQEEEEQRQIRQPQVKIKRRSAQQEKCLACLGIDRSLLGDKGMDFELMLSDFGWSTDVLKPKQLANLENSIRREQGRVEAGSWLSHADAAREERVAHVETLLDKAIAECDELEGLLTLYHVELSSLNDDIAFIEAQSQGLQVQSANQKLLQSELQGIVDTMSLDRRVMEPLRYGDLSEPAGLEEVENSLVRLYQAMLTLDPSMRSTHSRPRSRSGLADNETSSMVALREKKAIYDRETSEFCQRLMKFLDSKFMTSMNSVKGRVLRQAGTGGLAKLQPEAFNEARSALWMYGPLLLFTKELNPPAWNTLLRMYPQRANPLYKDSFRDNIQNWKRAARPSSGDELDVLFTTQEKEDPATGGLTSTARKLTVKRSQTLAKSLRGATGDRHGALELKQPGAMIKALSFAGALDEMAPLVSREQNFVVDLFHASSLETTDFIDAVQSMPPGGRRGTNLLERKPVEPDRALSGLVTKAMLTIFDFFLADLKAMQDWAFTDDPIQGVGVMTTLCRHMYFLQDSSQDYLLQLLDNLADSLKTRFVKFVDEQVRAIEDTKVKIKKRKGVIAFMKIFPHFSAAIENVYSAVAGNDYDGPAPSVMEVRKLVDDAYEKINRAMFDSLKVIAKESPGLAVQSGKPTHGTADDPEDKEMLNYHILLIENMNHYVEEVDDGGKAGVLADWKGRAMKERAEALDAYVGRVIRRPLGKLLDFLDAAESILSNSSGNAAALLARPSFSRKTVRTVLSTHDGREIRRGIDTLRKRIEKHFGEADEEQLSRSLVALVCKGCERSYERVVERLERLVKDVYPSAEGEKDVVVDFSKSDVQAGFRR